MNHEPRATGEGPDGDPSDYLPESDGGSRSAAGRSPDEESDELFQAPEKTPFSFKVMVVLGTLYVAWRVVELLLCGAELIGWGSLGPDWCS